MGEIKPTRHYARFIWPTIAVVIVGYVVYCSSRKELMKSAGTLLEIMIEVGITCFIGGILEYRSWLRFVSFIAVPLMWIGNLPKVCAAAFMSAVVSGNAAGMMLAEHRNKGRISRREMIFGGLCNTTPSMISFSLPIMLPVVGAIGIAGVIYYGITYGIAIAMMLGFLLIARLTANAKAKNGQTCEESHLPCYGWKIAIAKSWHRTTALLRRVMMVTAPLYLLTAYAIQRGFFNFGKDTIPAGWEKWLTPETLTILASRMGGMLSASGITAEMLNQHKVSVIQVVFVFILGNVINNPFRTMRRSLPVALGIYPGYDGALIVGILMSIRLLFNAVAATAIILIFN